VGLGLRAAPPETLDLVRLLGVTSFAGLVGLATAASPLRPID